jgi:hypothetical protein
LRSALVAEGGILSLLILEASGPKTPFAALQTALEAALMGAPYIRSLGPSKTLAWLCEAHGVHIERLCALDVLVRRQLVSLVCISSRAWRSTIRMEVYYQLAAACRDEGLEVRFVPEHFLMGGRVEEDRAVPGGVMKVGGHSLRGMLTHLIANGRSTLAQVARAARHPDPYQAVLHLVRVGLLESDLASPIDGDAPIFLPKCRR